jgi:hypothetical protein
MLFKSGKSLLKNFNIQNLWVKNNNQKLNKIRNAIYTPKNQLKLLITLKNDVPNFNLSVVLMILSSSSKFVLSSKNLNNC